MREISIKEFQASIKDSLKDIPFALTKRGKVIAYVVKDIPQQTKDIPHKKTSVKDIPHKFTPSEEELAIQAKQIPAEVKAKVKSIEEGKLPHKTRAGAKFGGHDPHRIGRQRMEVCVG